MRKPFKLAALISILTLGLFMVGCSQANLAKASKATGDISKTMVSPSTTQPSPLSAGIQIVENVAPATTPFISTAGYMLSGISLLLGGLAGGGVGGTVVASSKNETIDAHQSVIATVISDLKAAGPGLSVLKTTTVNLLNDLGVKTGIPTVTT